MANVPQISITIARSGFIIDIQGTGASVTFYPYDKDKTFDATISKCKELGQDLTLDMQNSEVLTERHNIDIQLTEIYKEYYDQVTNRTIKDEDQLLIIANSRIKHKFQDQTNKFYVVIEKDNHNEIIDIDYQEFDSLLAKMFFEAEKKMISKDKRNNVKTLLKAYTEERRVLYNRIARVGGAIYYDLDNEQRECVKITKEGWELVDNPLLFRPSANRAQVTPDRDYDKDRHYVKEIVYKSTIKHEHQKLIDEVYTVSLFIPDIAHPMDVTIGPKGSGKSMHLRVKKLIVDPRESFDELVEKLPRDERDRRVAIYDNYISYFDNESMLTYDEMDELCMWVTGFSKTIRILNTTDERRSYAGKRPIGINGINVPVTNSDILSRSFVNEHDVIADGKDGKDSKIERETKYLAGIKHLVPQILGYVFDILVKVLQRFDGVDAEVKSAHRLADFVIWGETISRVLGYEKNEFLKAWKLNTDTQQLTVIHSNSFAVLLIKYIFNKRVEKEFGIEPDELLKALKIFAFEIGIDYNNDKQLPTNAVWLTRRLNMIKSDLNIAGIEIDETKSNERMIWIKKDCPIHGRQHQQQKQLESFDEPKLRQDENNNEKEAKKKKLSLDRFTRLLREKKVDKINQDDFQLDLTSSGMFYMSEALFMIELLIKEGLLKKDEESLLSLTLT